MTSKWIWLTAEYFSLKSRRNIPVRVKIRKPVDLKPCGRDGHAERKETEKGISRRWQHFPTRREEKTVKET